jgi:hypothetical protein
MHLQLRVGRQESGESESESESERTGRHASLSISGRYRLGKTSILRLSVTQHM